MLMDFATLWLLDGAASYRISHRAAPYVNEFCHVVAFLDGVASYRIGLPPMVMYFATLWLLDGVASYRIGLYPMLMDFATLWLLDGAASYRISHRAALYVNGFCHVVAFGWCCIISYIA